MLRESIFTATRGASSSVCGVTCPVLKLRQESVTLMALTLCRTIGVVQPVGPPSVLVTFGRPMVVLGGAVAQTGLGVRFDELRLARRDRACDGRRDARAGEWDESCRRGGDLRAEVLHD